MSIEISLSRTRRFKVKENKRVEEKDGKGRNENTKNILYLIANYLKENGFVNTFECFTNDAQLHSNIEVCDNIDLNIILQGYINDYSKTFKTEPRLTKKVIKSTKDNISPLIKKQSEENGQCHVSSTTPGLAPRNSEQGTLQETESTGDTNCFNSPNDYSDLNVWKDLVDIFSKKLCVMDLQSNEQWQDIKGRNKEKWFLNEAVYFPIEFPEQYKTLPVPWKGILLFGPPRSGKISLIKALANQCQNANYFNVSFQQMTHWPVLGGDQLVKTVFDFAKYHASSIVCLHKIEHISAQQDELKKLNDVAKKTRLEFLERIKFELLKLIHGIYATNEHVFLLATSDSPWDIDPDILSCFEKYIPFRSNNQGPSDKERSYYNFFHSPKYFEWEKKYRTKFL